MPGQTIADITNRLRSKYSLALVLNPDKGTVEFAALFGGNAKPTVEMRQWLEANMVQVKAALTSQIEYRNSQCSKTLNEIIENAARRIGINGRLNSADFQDLNFVTRVMGGKTNDVEHGAVLAACDELLKTGAEFVADVRQLMIKWRQANEQV